MNPGCVIGLDVGGTKIASGCLRLPHGEPVAGRVIPTRADRGGQAVLNDVVALTRELATTAEPNGGRVLGIGLGLCELVDREGAIRSANCIPWLDLPVRETLSTLAPARIEADVRAAAAAESALGAGRPYRQFLYVTVGTGISCCLMLDGQPFLGAQGLTGTMASTPLAVPCEQCGHMNHRTLEDLAAGPALVARYRAAGGRADSGRDVLAAAVEGSGPAREIVASAAEALSAQLGLWVSALDPEAVVVGGGLGMSSGPYWDSFIISTRRHIWSSVHRELPILRAESGVDAGWIGAAVLAAKHLGYQLNPEPRHE